MSSSVENSVVVLSPLDLVDVVVKRKWTVVAFVLAFVLAATAYVSLVAQPLYTAHGRLVIGAPKSFSLSMQSIGRASNVDTAALYTDAQELMSLDLLKKVQVALAKEGLGQPDTRRTGDASSEDEGAVLKGMQKRLKAEVEDDSQVIAVDFEDTSRQRAKRTLQILFREYLNTESQRAQGANRAVAEQLRQQIGALKQALEKTNRRMVEKAKGIGLYKAGTSSLLSRNLEAISDQLTDIDTKAAATSAHIRILSQALKEGRWVEVSRTIDTPIMNKLWQEVEDIKIEASTSGSGLTTKEFPDNRARAAQLAALHVLVKQEYEAYLEGLKEERSHLADERSSLQARMTELTTRSRAQVHGSVLLTQLQQEAQSLRGTLGVAQGKLYDAEALPISTVWVMDSPRVSADPTSPKVGITLAAATFGGFVVGLVWVLVAEGKERTAKSALELVRAEEPLGFWTLPKWRQPETIWNNVIDERQSMVSSRWQETLRAIGYSLEDGRGEAESPSVAVLSAEAGEGKTLFSMALARFLASEGHRVLLVDCDLRKPGVAKVLGSPFEGSLADWLEGGGQRWRRFVYHDTRTGLDCLAPSVATFPPTTVLKGQIRTLLQDAKEHYDFVVLDTSPLLRVADSVVVTKLVDRAIFVKNPSVSREMDVRDALLSLGEPLHKISAIVQIGGKREARDKLVYRGY